MKITQEVDYALRVVLYLSKLGYGEKIEARAISENENIPLRFLLKLLRKLTQVDVIKSYRGVNGGYALNKLPEHITLRKVVEAIDGPIYVNRCQIEPGSCNLGRANRCEVHRALGKVQSEIISQLEGITFKDLVDGKV